MKLGAKIFNLRRDLGMTQAEFGARLANLPPKEDPIPQTTIAKWEGNLQQPRPDKVARLAKLAKTTTAKFQGLEHIPISSLPGQLVQVVAALQAGVWSENPEWPEEDRYEVPVKLPELWEGTTISAAEVRGDSMNLFYPEGSVVFLAPLEQVPGGLKHGMHVMVVRKDGDVYETTLKEYRADEHGVRRLVPRSSSKSHRKPIVYAKRGSEVQILAVVVASMTIAPGIGR